MARADRRPDHPVRPLQAARTDRALQCVRGQGPRCRHPRNRPATPELHGTVFGPMGGALYRHRRRHVYCTGTDVPVLKMAALARARQRCAAHAHRMPTRKSRRMSVRMSVHMSTHARVV